MPAPTSPLLARITAALAAATAATALITACGETTNGGTDGPVTCLRALPKETADSTGRTLCHTDEDCPDKSFTSCFPPGQSSCSGSIGGERIPSCASDGDCASQGAGTVCEPKHDGHAYCEQKCTGDDTCDAAFACEVATGHCVARSCETTACPAETFCTAAKVCAYQRCNEKRACQEGFSCDATFACAPTPCTGAATAECPGTHACDAATKTCQRKSCACDTECGSGYCVEKSCYASAGSCQGACAAGRPLLDEAGDAVLAPLVRGSTLAAW